MYGTMSGSETDFMGSALSGIAKGLTVAAVHGGKISGRQILADAFGNAIGESLGEAFLASVRDDLSALGAQHRETNQNVALDQLASAVNSAEACGSGVEMSWDEKFRRYGTQVAASGTGGIQYDSSFQTGGSVLSREEPDDIETLRLQSLDELTQAQRTALELGLGPKTPIQAEAALTNIDWGVEVRPLHTPPVVARPLDQVGVPDPEPSVHGDTEGFWNERRRNMIDPTRDPMVRAAGTGLASLAAVVWGTVTGNDGLVQAGFDGARDLGIASEEGALLAVSLALGGRQGRAPGAKPAELASPTMRGETPSMGPNDGPQLPEWGGPTDYTGVANPRNIEASTKPTPRQVREMKAANRENNGGVLRDDVTGEFGIDSAKSTRGVTPPSNEIQVDHIKPVDAGGTRDNMNLELRLRTNNRLKSNKWNGNQ